MKIIKSELAIEWGHGAQGHSSILKGIKSLMLLGTEVEAKRELDFKDLGEHKFVHQISYKVGWGCPQ